MSETGAVRRATEPRPPQTMETKPASSLDRINRIFDDIARRAFEIFEQNGHVVGRDLEDWFQAERELLRPVSINLTETERAYEISAEMPGFTPKELDVTVEPRRVVIAGKHEAKAEKQQEKGKAVRSETRSEQMLRVVALPGPIETAKATATLLKDGTLKLALPKLVPAEAVRIQPSAG